MTKIDDDRTNIGQKRHKTKHFITFPTISVTPNDIKLLMVKIRALSGWTREFIYEKLDISATHYKRALKNPEQYADAIDVLELKCKALIEELEAAKKNQALNPSLTSYGNKTYNTNANSPGNLNQKLNRLDILEDVVHAQNKALIEQNKALLEYIASDGAEEDKKILRGRIEQANALLQSSTTNTQESTTLKFITHKPRKKKSKKDDPENSTPAPDEPTS
jgi:hypothetical protein